jgi:hypothetical protein
VSNWDNFFTEGPIREEDSSGNYVIQQTNNELELVIVDADSRPTFLKLGGLQRQVPGLQVFPIFRCVDVEIYSLIDPFQRFNALTFQRSQKVRCSGMFYAAKCTDGRSRR